MNDARQSRGRNRLGELDALRGMAAMGVVLFHFTNIYQSARPSGTFSPSFACPWGASGVWLFFMISGFVIAMTAEKKRTAITFIQSRFARLYPMYWASILLACAVAAVGGPSVRWQNAVVNITMMQDAVGVKNICDVYWTLYIELLFYFVFAVFLGLRSYRVAPWFLLSLLLADTLATFPQAWDRVPGWWRITLAFPLLRHLYLFVFGIWLYRAKYKGDRWLPLVAAACLANRFGKGMSAHDIWLHVGLAATLVLAVFGRLPLLKHRALVWMGSISYALYLCHMNYGFLMMDWFLAAGLSSDFVVIAVTAISVGLAAALTWYIDRPAHNFVIGILSKPRPEIVNLRGDSAAPPVVGDVL